MIIIGEKLNGSIPSVAKAISEKDADLIRERARMQAEAGATFLDVCASVEEDVEVETLKWMIDLVQEVTDTPICVDSPSAKSCVAAIPFCKRPGLINSVSLEGDKIDTIFPVIADTDWECVALLCDNDGIPDSVERRMKIFFGIMEKADNVYVSLGDFGWSDLGTWGSLYDLSERDQDGNVTLKCHSLIYNSKDNMVVLPKGKLAVIDGLEGYLIAESNNVLLICRKDEEHAIRKYVNDAQMQLGDDFI